MRLPPRRRARYDARSMVAAPARAGNTRRAVAESPSSKPGKPQQRDRKRRMVDISPIEATRAGEVIELVAKDAVAAAESDVEDELDSRERQRNVGDGVAKHRETGA